MKDFKNFKSLIMDNSEQIAESIKDRVEMYASCSEAKDLDTYYKRAWAEFTTLELLERYHQWISGVSPKSQEGR